MRHRVLLLPAVCVATFALVSSSPEPRPVSVSEAPPERLRRLATPKELADAQSAYKALGGGYSDEGYQDKAYHRFTAPTPLTAESLAKLPDIPFDYTLRVIVGPETPPGTLKGLARLQNLHRVDIATDPTARYDRRGNELRINVSPHVTDLASVPNLEVLAFDSNFDKLLADELAAILPSFPSLRFVAGHGPITDAGLAHLARCPKLQRVSLQACDSITDAGLAHLATIPTLRALSVQDCPRLTASGVRHFTKEPRLTDLAIGGEDMKEDAIAEVEKITTLEELNLITFYTPLTDRTLAHVGRLPLLRELQLPKSTTYTDAGLRDLAAAPALEDLHLPGGTRATDAGFRELARIKSLKHLRITRADQMTDEGLKELGSLPKLESFSLRHAPRITDQGAKAFADRRGGTLRSLYFSFTPVTDHLTADLPKLTPNLRQLGFYECKAITDKSVAPLAQLVNLSDLSVRDTSITPDGAEALRQQLPACNVDGPRRGSNAGHFR